MKTNPSYCTAPWVETHLYYDGQTRLCDHNQESFGNWQQTGLPSVWRGEGYREVRRKMMRGEFPNEQCRACYLNQTTSKLSNHVFHHFGPVAERLLRALGREIPEIAAAARLLGKGSDNWNEVLQGLFRVCAELRRDPAAAEQQHALAHLVLLGEIAEDFLAGKEVPRHVGPSRQVRLINKCNARCIMCAGNFNGDIVNGPGMPEEFVAKTMEPVEDVISYASEASEFLLFRKWREIAEKLSENGLPKLRIYTNGILATKDTVRYLLDRKVLEAFHFSLNGATKETIESGQVNVKFPVLVENIRNFFAHAESSASEFQLTFSFIIMRRNFHEMPTLLRLVQELRGENRRLRPLIYFAFLETNNEMDNYREFLFQEHHSLVPEGELRRSFAETARLGHEFDIPITLFETTFDDFLASGQKPPPLVCKERDVRLLVKGLKLGSVSEACLRAVQGTTPEIEELLGKLRGGAISEVEAALAVSDLVLEEKNDVLVEGFAAIERSEANRWRWALGSRQSIEFTAHPGPNQIQYRFFLPRAGTQLSLSMVGMEPVRIHAAEAQGEVAGKLVFHSPGRQRMRVEIDAQPGAAPVSSRDGRPLAYSVYSFAHSRGV